MKGFVVESTVLDQATGKPCGTARIYCATEDRAQIHAAAKPGATYREISLSDMPQAARENLERAAAQPA